MPVKSDNVKDNVSPIAKAIVRVKLKSTAEAVPIRSGLYVSDLMI